MYMYMHGRYSNQDLHKTTCKEFQLITLCRSHEKKGENMHSDILYSFSCASKRTRSSIQTDIYFAFLKNYGISDKNIGFIGKLCTVIAWALK